MFTGRVLSEALSFDGCMIEMRRSGIPVPVCQALAAVLGQDALADLARVLRPPEDILGFARQVQDLVQGSQSTTEAGLWWSLAEAAEALADRQPLAAAFAAFYAAAGWEGTLGDGLYLQPWGGHHPGWHRFPLVLARCLVAAEAIWAARFTVREAAGFIAAAREAHFLPELRRVLEAYRRVEGLIAHRLQGCVGDLAWDLRQACQRHGDAFRPAVAAMLWSLGDVPRARMTAAPASGYLPPYEGFRALVAASLRRMPRDPFLQYLWLDLKDVPPLDLRRHVVLFGRINARYQATIVHQLDTHWPQSPSRIYARALAGYFGASTDAAAVHALPDALELGYAMFQDEAPLEWLRLHALGVLLLIGEPRARQRYWRHLARFATAVMAWTTEQAAAPYLERGLEIPFFYLAARRREQLVRTLDRVERYRAAALAYWLAVNPPPAKVTGEAEPLLEEERALLAELRGARFIRLLPLLPRHYRRHGRELGEMLEEQQPAASGQAQSAAADFHDPFDQRRAVDELAQVRQALDALYQRLEVVVPEYVSMRRDPFQGVAQLQALLQAHRRDSSRPADSGTD